MRWRRTALAGLLVRQMTDSNVRIQRAIGPSIVMVALVVGIAIVLESLGRADRLRNVNVAASNVAVVALALATLWPHSLPSAQLIGPRAHQLARHLAYSSLFVGYGAAVAHYACSFVLLGDPEYLRFVKARPAGVIVAILSSLFVAVLSVQCLSGDGKVKAFAIRINGVILTLFTAHLMLLNDWRWSRPPRLPDESLAQASMVICACCVLLYARARLARWLRARGSA